MFANESLRSKAMVRKVWGAPPGVSVLISVQRLIMASFFRELAFLFDKISFL